jgi:hypothetical protein
VYIVPCAISGALFRRAISARYFGALFPRAISGSQSSSRTPGPFKQRLAFDTVICTHTMPHTSEALAVARKWVERMKKIQREYRALEFVHAAFPGREMQKTKMLALDAQTAQAKKDLWEMPTAHMRACAKLSGCEGYD